MIDTHYITETTTKAITQISFDQKIVNVTLNNKCQLSSYPNKGDDIVTLQEIYDAVLTIWNSHEKEEGKLAIKFPCTMRTNAEFAIHSPWKFSITTMVI